MATNINHKDPYKMRRNQAYIICRIVADNLGLDTDHVTPDSKLENLGADIQDVLKIISCIEAYTNYSFEENAEELAASITYVDDLIEKALGISFFGKNLLDDDEDEDEEDDEVDVEAEEERFESFVDSYVHGEYAEYDIHKLAGMFLHEAENCKDDGLAAKYLCVSAVVRMQYFYSAWKDFGFDNYRDDECSQDLAKYCIIDALEAIEKCKEIESNNTEYNLVLGILRMIADYWMARKPLSEVVSLYDELDSIYGTNDDGDIFNRDSLLETYALAYNALVDIYSSLLQQEKEYKECFNEMLEDYGEIGPRERKRLERDRKRLGITEGRAQELEAYASTSSLTEEEQKYLDEYREMMEDYGGKLGPIEIKRLDRLRLRLGIDRFRVHELEKL